MSEPMNEESIEGVQSTAETTPNESPIDVFSPNEPGSHLSNDPADVPMTDESNPNESVPYNPHQAATATIEPAVVSPGTDEPASATFLHTPPTPAESAMDLPANVEPISNGTKPHESSVMDASIDENTMDDTSQEEPSTAGDQQFIFENELKDQTMFRTMQRLKSKVDEILALKQSGDKQRVMEVYKKEMIPHMLRLRGSHRDEIDNLQGRFDRVQDLNMQLMRLYRECDCIEYQVAKMGSLVVNTDDIPKVDHETKLKLLDQELAKRKDLQHRFGELERETRQIEELCSSTGSMVEDLKPYIKQLIDKVPKKSQ